jgi:glycosyltransferase involved in cell wall biosynthesis
VVAGGVGGLLTLVDHGASGFLVPNRDPELYAEHIAHILDNPEQAASMGHRGAARAQRYTWGFAAARLRRVYADVAIRELVACA